MKTQQSAVLSYFAVVPKSRLLGIPITATAQDIHHGQYLQPHTIPHGPNDSPPHPLNKKNPAHYIIEVFWYHMTNWL
jgi:hypothetical protein